MKIVFYYLMCSVVCFNGVQFDSWVKVKKHIPVTQKIGENLTLDLEENSEAEEIVWVTNSTVFLKCFAKDKEPCKTITNTIKLCSFNCSSITICNVAREDMGVYKAQIKYGNRTYKNIIYYVGEYNGFCDKITTTNGKEGQTVNLSVEGFRTGSKIRWIKDNGAEIEENERYKIAANGSLSIYNVTKEDEGNYTGNAQTENAPECNHTFTLIVVSPHDAPSHSSSLSDNKNIYIAVGVLVVLLPVGIIVAIVIWRKHRNTAQSPDNPINASEPLQQEHTAQDPESPTEPDERDPLNSNQQNGVHSNEDETVLTIERAVTSCSPVFDGLPSTARPDNLISWLWQV